MGKEYCGGGNRTERGAPPAGLLEKSENRPEMQRRGKREERIHAHLVRLFDFHRHQRQQQCRGEPGGRAGQPPREQEDGRDVERGANRRGRTHGRLAVAEQADDRPQDEIVQRRIIVLGRPEEHIGEAAACLEPGIALVDPQAARAEVLEAQHGGEGQHRGERRRMAPVRSPAFAQRRTGHPAPPDRVD